jgi:hypothetical protein
MRLLQVLLLTALGAACKPAPAPAPAAPPPLAQAELDGGPSADEEDPRAWVSHSADGKATLRQKSVGGLCYAECRLGEGALAWEGVAPCLAEKYERHFFSNDCERVVVLTPAPDRGKAWSSTVVMRVYARNQLEYSVSGSTVVSEQRMRTSTSWLAGCYGAPGAEPRYAPDGASVVYETVEGRAGSIPLAAPPRPSKSVK